MENGGGNGNGGEALPPNGGFGEGKVAQALDRSFGQVQGILEHNRLLIQEIEQNQESREAGGLSRNVVLIRELNSNIARVASLYADLSNAFCKSVAKDSPAADKAADAAKGYNKRSRPPQ